MSISRSISSLTAWGEAGCRVWESRKIFLSPFHPLEYCISQIPENRLLLSSLPPAVSVPGAFEHPGCRKKEGISERLHWVRKNAKAGEGCGFFTGGGSE